ncbi:hypothetical protein CYMTET_35009, partial [Cymbomonas tetramitiformis]
MRRTRQRHQSIPNLLKTTQALDKLQHEAGLDITPHSWTGVVQSVIPHGPVPSQKNWMIREGERPNSGKPFRTLGQFYTVAPGVS